MDALPLSCYAPVYSSVNPPNYEAGSSSSSSSSTILARMQFGSINNTDLAGIRSTSAVQEPQETPRRRRTSPENHDPDVEVVALSPNTLLAINEYVCEICHRSFPREQNLQLHMKSHKYNVVLKKNPSRENQNKKVFICPDESCRHHHVAKALGGLTGMKKHYQRKHGIKKFKCNKCRKTYGVLSDLKAHLKICGTKDYVCNCGFRIKRRLSYQHKGVCGHMERPKSMTSVNNYYYYQNNNINIQPPPNLIASNVQHASLFPTEALPPAPLLPPQWAASEASNYSMTSDASSMLGLSSPLGEMMMLGMNNPPRFPTSQLQYVGGVNSHAATLPNNNNDYYGLMPGQSHPGQLTRDFLSLAGGIDGGGGVVGGTYGNGSSYSSNDMVALGF